MIMLKITFILALLLVFDVVVFNTTDFTNNFLIASVVVFATELENIKKRL